MMSRHLRYAAIALALSPLVLPAAQAATASATLTGVYIQLFDINPLDAFTPGFSLDYNGISVNGSATNAPLSYNQNSSVGSGLAGSAGDATVGSSSEIFAGDFYALVGRPGATATATATGLNTEAYGIGWLLGTNYTLTPGTLVVITATAQASAAATLGERASALAYLQLSDDAGNVSIGQAYKSIWADGSSYQNGGPLAAQVSFANVSGASVSGFVGVYAEASAFGVTVVPEPDTYGLMSAGLLALGLLARRRLPR